MSKRRRRPPGEAPRVPESRSTPGRTLPSWVGIAAAAAAVIVFFTLLRAAAPNPWDYDEYFHLGMAREFAGGVPESLRWTPFSLAYEHFADKELLFHVLLMPLSGTFSCDKGWPRTAMGCYTGALALFGLTPTFVLIGLNGDESPGIVRSFGGLCVLLFLVGAFLSPWVANGLAMAKPKR